ncbi:MAG: hypothetical protein RIF36_27340 [Imperialibacter sp.]|uniref:hypothetical protein n=1 Tax=Imperialibacter sp. TaxID=2038411 RepID=UPI0032EF328B
MSRVKTILEEFTNKPLQVMLPSKAYLDLLFRKRGSEEPEMRQVYDLFNRPSSFE